MKRHGPTVDPAAYDRHEAAIAVAVNVLFVRHLIDTYRAFDGDLVEAIVLGEIAHHNLAAVRTTAADLRGLSQQLAGDASPGLTLLPTNAYSIAEACGIPRETVRRKVTRLVRRGWIAKDAGGNLFVTPLPQAHFSDVNRARCHELLQAAREIEDLLASKRSEARAGRSHIPRPRPSARRRPSTQR